MLRHNSNTTLQAIFSNSIPHDDTFIKASTITNFNEAHKCLLITFCLKNPLSQIVQLNAIFFWHGKLQLMMKECKPSLSSNSPTVNLGNPKIRNL